MRRYLLCTLFIFILSGCSSIDSTQVFDQRQAAQLLNQGSSVQRTQQRIQLTSLNKAYWQRIDMSYGTVGSPVMLIPANETRDTWQQSIRTKIKPFVADATMNAEKWVHADIEFARQHCQRVDTDYVTAIGRDVSYQIHLSQCRDDVIAGTQIGKAFMGKDAVYVVYYTATVNANADDVQRGVKIIKNARLVSVI